MMAKKSIIQEKSQLFSGRIVKLNAYLVHTEKEKVLSKQVLRSGTSIGANVSEAIFAQSTADFISKLSIALKEANETRYRILMLRDGNYLSDDSLILCLPMWKKSYRFW